MGKIGWEEVRRKGLEVGGILASRRERVVVVESTTGGLISAALVSCPGASRFFVSSCTVYGSQTFLDRETIIASGVLDREFNYANEVNYVGSKEKYVQVVASRVRDQFSRRNAWVVVESGTTGPDFYIPGVTSGFTAVGICPPHGSTASVRVVRTESKEREENMMQFAFAALEELGRALVEKGSAKL